MILRLALFLWLGAFVLSFLAKAQGRLWVMRLFVGGFCLLLLGLFIRIISRIL
jgi:hypothetical protein